MDEQISIHFESECDLQNSSFDQTLGRHERVAESIVIIRRFDEHPLAAQFVPRSKIENVQSVNELT